jgi:hypothetical protein
LASIGYCTAIGELSAREAIVDGETGLLFRSDDASDLSAKLMLLNRDPNLVAHLGLRA